MTNEERRKANERLRIASLTKASPTSQCPSKCTTPPSAKLGVDPTTQAVAISITVKTRFMITTPVPFGLR
jgi:hypothetical protein